MALHNMVSLKAKKQPKSALGELDDFSPPEFPTSLFLHKEQIDALSLGGKDVGDEFEMTIKVKVQSKSERSSEKGQDHKSLDLEVHEAEVKAPPSKTAAETLFGSE